MKVCMITTRHLPGDPRIFEKEARSLARLGYQVEIVVPEGPVPEDSGGVRFRTFRKKGGPLRKFSTLFYAVRLAREANADCYHCHEIDASLWAGLWLKWRRPGTRLVFDCHEFWPAYFAARLWRPLRPLVKLLFLGYDWFLLRQCDGIITANMIEKNYYQILDPLKKIYLLYNVPHPVEEASVPEEAEHQDPEYDLCFEGFLKFDRGLKEMFELVRRLRARHQKIRLLILGTFVDETARRWAEAFIAEHQLQEHIVFAGWQPYHKLYQFHRRCRVGIFLYHYSPSNLLSGPPNKLFNFMRAGLPIVASRLPETANIIEEVGCGILVDPEDLEEIESAVCRLLENRQLREEMGQRSYEAFLNRYNWNIEEQKLRALYEKLSGDLP
ncbi:MAG: glycosyltransferase [Calditrichaeota bacterium]|nr:MAG: glycosyltransferase [Calditrichota bacterium]